MISKEYIEIQKNSLNIVYPAYMKKRLLSILADKGLIINNKRMSNGGNNLLLPDVSYYEDVNSKINFLFENMNNERLIKSIEDLEFSKEYRHMLWFEVGNFNIERIFEKIKNDGNDTFLLYNDEFKHDIVDYNASTVSIKQSSSNLYIKFNYLLEGKTDSFKGKKIKFIVLVRIDIENKILEICFDKVKFDFKPTQNFYSEIINSTIEKMEDLFEISVVTIDFKELIHYIKRVKEDVVIVAMKMRRNGTIAHLDSFENEDYVIPILGELKMFMEDNATLLSANNKCEEIKKKLDYFINTIEETSDLPNVKLVWPEERINIGADHNYHDQDYSLFMLYDELNEGRRRIDYVRDYFIKCYKELGEQVQSDSLPGSADGEHS